MATVHYKFKNAKNYSSVLFDGAYITVANLKKDIIKATYGPSSEVDLSIQNAQTKQGEPGATWCAASATHRLRIVAAVSAIAKAQYTQPNHSLSSDTHNRPQAGFPTFGRCETVCRTRHWMPGPPSPVCVCKSALLLACAPVPPLHAADSTLRALREKEYKLEEGSRKGREFRDAAGRGGLSPAAQMHQSVHVSATPT